MRRIISVLAVMAIAAVMLSLSVAPAFADSFHNGYGDSKNTYAGKFDRGNSNAYGDWHN